MNCFNCGAPLNDGAAFCPNCGSKQPENPNPAPAPGPAPGYGAGPAPGYTAGPTPGYGGAAVAPGPGGAKFLSNLSKGQKITMLVSLVMVVVMILVLIFGGIFGGIFGVGKKGAVNKYYKAIEKCDAGIMLDCIPKKLVNEILDEADMSRKELEEEVQDYMDDEYDYDSVKVKEYKDSDKADKDEIDDLNEMFESELDVDINIKGAVAYRVEVRYESDGGDQRETETETVTVIKVGGSWYCMNAVDVVTKALSGYSFY